MIRERFQLRSLAVALGLMAAVGPVVPDVTPERHRAMIAWSKRKPQRSKGGRHWRAGLISAGQWKARGGMRRHCTVCKARFKHLRIRYVLEDETSGLRRSIKAKQYCCPRCTVRTGA